MFKILKIALILLFFFSFPLFIRAANSLDVVINEVAWMGTEISYSDEWIELYNNIDKDIELNGWILKAENGTPNITLSGSLPEKGFFILERTDDNTLPDILADQVYKGSLENTGEILELYDNLGNLMDSVDCSSGWFAGDNKTKQTMERKDPKLLGSDPKSWQTSKNSGGTPKAENTSGGDSPSGTVPQTPQTKVYPSNIFINEILPSPEGPDSENEWIEIFNENDFEIDISDWQIRDTIGKTKTYTLPEGTKIPPEGFFLLKRPITKITLNNDGDGLKLIQPDGKLVDEVSYEKAPLGQSYNRTKSGWIWSENLTPGFPNIIRLPISKPEKETKEKKIQEFTNKRELAAIGEQTPKEISSLFPISIASGVAIFSAIIILILKKKLIHQLPPEETLK